MSCKWSKTSIVSLKWFFCKSETSKEPFYRYYACLRERFIIYYFTFTFIFWFLNSIIVHKLSTNRSFTFSEIRLFASKLVLLQQQQIWAVSSMNTQERNDIRWKMKTGSETVGIVQVCRDNWTSVLPAINRAMKDATFFAIDTEFSGLGSDKRARMAK